jgi:hypothetical protein
MLGVGSMYRRQKSPWHNLLWVLFCFVFRHDTPVGSRCWNKIAHFVACISLSPLAQIFIFESILSKTEDGVLLHLTCISGSGWRLLPSQNNTFGDFPPCTCTLPASSPASSEHHDMSKKSLESLATMSEQDKDAVRMRPKPYPALPTTNRPHAQTTFGP